MYLNVKEVAELLAVKPVTVYKWIREGQLKGTFAKIGGTYRFDSKKVEHAIQRRMEHYQYMGVIKSKEDKGDENELQDK